MCVCGTLSLSLSLSVTVLSPQKPAIEGMQLQKTMNRDSKRFNSSRTLAASTSPTERISRPAVMSWDKQSSASTSVASTSSRDDVVPARGQVGAAVKIAQCHEHRVRR